VCLHTSITRKLLIYMPTRQPNNCRRCKHQLAVMCKHSGCWQGLTMRLLRRVLQHCVDAGSDASGVLQMMRAGR
jgi:hypothetical protein